MKKQNLELLNTQLGTEENPNKQNSSELIERITLGKGPIVIMGNKETGYAPCIGMHRLTEWKETIQEATNIAEALDWEFLVNMISAITVDTIKQEAPKIFEKIQLEQNVL